MQQCKRKAAALPLTLMAHLMQAAWVTPLRRVLKVPAGHLTGVTVLVLGQ